MWELFYAADPWGELRADMRTAALLINTTNPQSEVTMFHPYFEKEDEVDDAARYQSLQAELAAIGQDKIQEALKRGREKFLAEKAKRG